MCKKRKKLTPEGQKMRKNMQFGSPWRATSAKTRAKWPPRPETTQKHAALKPQGGLNVEKHVQNEASRAENTEKLDKNSDV